MPRYEDYSDDQFIQRFLELTCECKLHSEYRKMSEALYKYEIELEGEVNRMPEYDNDLQKERLLIAQKELKQAQLNYIVGFQEALANFLCTLSFIEDDYKFHMAKSQELIDMFKPAITTPQKRIDEQQSQKKESFSDLLKRLREQRQQKQ